METLQWADDQSVTQTSTPDRRDQSVRRTGPEGGRACDLSDGCDTAEFATEVIRSWALHQHSRLIRVARLVFTFEEFDRQGQRVIAGKYWS
jgi:hypothetical protein